MQLEYSHELVRLNCQGAQQTKLIDFLQSRVEELEPSDKKKKKVSSNQGWEKWIFDIAILYFLFIECNGAFTFLNVVFTFFRLKLIFDDRFFSSRLLYLTLVNSKCLSVCHSFFADIFLLVPKLQLKTKV